jgi:hypothetical protein
MFISIDVGGTNSRIAAFDNLKGTQMLGTPIERRNTHVYSDDLAFLINSARRFSALGSINAVGICTPGTSNEAKTELISAKNLTSWVKNPLVIPLSQSLDCPVYLENDAVAAGIGESYYGTNNSGAFHYLIWGTGIGGVTINDLNGDIQSAKINWSKNFKKWELDCGGAEIEKEFGKKPENFTNSEWLIIRLRMRQHLEWYIQANSPASVVFGGGIAVKHSELIERSYPSRATKVEVTKFGENSGLIGALGVIRRSFTSLD